MIPISGRNESKLHIRIITRSNSARPQTKPKRETPKQPTIYHHSMQATILLVLMHAAPLTPHQVVGQSFARCSEYYHKSIESGE
jgi:hypothetical protein